MRILDLTSNPSAAKQLTARRLESNREIEERAREILDLVKEGGDIALIEFTRKYDSREIEIAGLRVSEKELAEARKKVGRDFLTAITLAHRNIIRFHRKQKLPSWTLKSAGMSLGQRVRPLRRVGIYVPGGKAAYPSTVLMNAIPAAIAGVPEIVMVTPCGKDGTIRPEVLVAASLCGVKEIYRIGGAQAIAALAFGTETIRPVDKITGPGNAYVAAAKKLVFGSVGIDMIAGPTEVVIVADVSANPTYVAADMIAQAEHDELASPILITTSANLIPAVEKELTGQLKDAPRREIANQALENCGALVLVPSLDDAVRLVNELAPEHLEVQIRHPKGFIAKVTNAGAIFVGKWSTEALGDYLVGTNHTLPTMSTARFSSALSVFDFLHFTNVVEVSERRFRALAPHLEVLAKAEGLYGHAASATVRRKTP